MSGERRTTRSPPCLRCKAQMDEILTIEPVIGEPGLIAYECSRCGYVTSVLLDPIDSDKHR